MRRTTLSARGRAEVRSFASDAVPMASRLSVVDDLKRADQLPSSIPIRVPESADDDIGSESDPTCELLNVGMCRQIGELVHICGRNERAGCEVVGLFFDVVVLAALCMKVSFFEWSSRWAAS